MDGRSVRIPQRPSVTISFAQTLDGRIATISGNSRWISGPESLQLTHRLRAAHDAIVVGSGTVAADNPQLTVRLVAGRDPLRVVVDSRLRTALDANVLSGKLASGTILAVTRHAPCERREAVERRGATVLVLQDDADGHVDLAALLTTLGDRGVASVMVEGGAGLITAFLRARLVDRMVVTIAPKVLGRGIDAVGNLGISDLARAIQVTGVTYARYGDDMVIDGRVGSQGEDDGG